MVILVLILIICVILFIGLHEKNTNAFCKSNKQLNEKVAVVTGGTSGMGLEISHDLAKRGAKVIIACPFEEEGIKAKQEIIEATGNTNVIFKLLDLASPKSIREFANEILKSEDRLDLLINNAGVFFPKNSKSYNGTNFIMHVNYFGHFLLTMLLLPILNKSGKKEDPSRIVNVASCLHWFGEAEYKHVKSTSLWYRFCCYNNSKFCFASFSHKLSKRLKGSNVVVNAVDPGAVGTKLFDCFDVLSAVILRIGFYYFFKTPFEGAQTALHVALDENTAKVSGEYFKNCKLSRAKKSVRDDTIAEKIWEDSIKIVQLEEKELPSKF